MKWISVKDQIPSHDEPIVYCIPAKDGIYMFHVGIAYWTVSKKWKPDIYSEKNKEGFTHWLSLPDAPNNFVQFPNEGKEN